MDHLGLNQHRQLEETRQFGDVANVMFISEQAKPVFEFREGVFHSAAKSRKIVVVVLFFRPEASLDGALVGHDDVARREADVAEVAEPNIGLMVFS